MEWWTVSLPKAAMEEERRALEQLVSLLPVSNNLVNINTYPL